MSRLIRELGFPGFYGCDFFVEYAKVSMKCKDADKHIESGRKVKYRRFFDETMWEKTKVDSEIIEECAPKSEKDETNEIAAIPNSIFESWSKVISRDDICDKINDKGQCK